MNNIFLSAEIEQVEFTEIQATDGRSIPRYYFQIYREHDESDRIGAMKLRVTWTPKIKDREKATTLSVGDTVSLTGKIVPDINGMIIIRARDIDKIA